MRRTAFRNGGTTSGRITGMLGQYLPSLRPAPVIALTATATPLVQDDIWKQLGLAQTGAVYPWVPAVEYRDRGGGGRAVAAA